MLLMLSQPTPESPCLTTGSNSKYSLPCVVLEKPWLILAPSHCCPDAVKIQACTEIPHHSRLVTCFRRLWPSAANVRIKWEHIKLNGYQSKKPDEKSKSPLVTDTKPMGARGISLNELIPPFVKCAQHGRLIRAEIIHLQSLISFFHILIWLQS